MCAMQLTPTIVYNRLQNNNRSWGGGKHQGGVAPPPQNKPVAFGHRNSSIRYRYNTPTRLPTFSGTSYSRETRKGAGGCRKQKHTRKAHATAMSCSVTYGTSLYFCVYCAVLYVVLYHVVLYQVLRYYIIRMALLCFTL